MIMRGGPDIGSWNDNAKLLIYDILGDSKNRIHQVEEWKYLEVSLGFEHSGPKSKEPTVQLEEKLKKWHKPTICISNKSPWEYKATAKQKEVLRDNFVIVEIERERPLSDRPCYH